MTIQETKEYIRIQQEKMQAILAETKATLKDSGFKMEISFEEINYSDLDDPIIIPVINATLYGATEKPKKSKWKERVEEMLKTQSYNRRPDR